MASHVLQVLALQGKENSFIERKRRLADYSKLRVHGFYWLNHCQERRGVFFLLGFAFITGHESSIFWDPDYLTEVSFY